MRDWSTENKIMGQGQSSLKSSGAVKDKRGWSQSGTLIAGEFASSFIPLVLVPPAHVVNMQVNFAEDDADMHTIQFGVTPALALAQNQQAPQPTPTPPNPMVVDANGNPSPASVTNGSPTVLFPPPSGNSVVPGNPVPVPVAGQFVQFSNDPTRIYQVLTFVAPSTMTLTTPFKGTSQLRAGVSIMATSPINATPAPPSGVIQAIDSYAVIQFTVAGNKIQRVISVGNGTSISGPGEALQVQVFDNSYRPSSKGFAYDVSIQVTSGLRAAVNQPAILSWTYPQNAEVASSAGPDIPQPFWEIVVPPAGFLLVQIPQNAGIVSYNLSSFDASHPGAAPVLVVTQEDAAGDDLSNAYFGPPNPGAFIPLAPGATALLIQNPTADNNTATIIWGVDG
jgi:hypothetical protein